ncbi:condensation domain-containing protein, partial [Actinomadura sp. 9N215]|uniref:condensation domain-containing protein n=1 Tax=Actinomadura sp. 9N215 TaxID=3375150 RepID=UPI00378E06AE
LGLGELAADAGFFALGGDSLLAARALTRLREHHGLDLSYGELVRDPTPAGIAATARRVAIAGGPAPGLDGPSSSPHPPPSNGRAPLDAPSSSPHPPPSNGRAPLDAPSSSPHPPPSNGRAPLDGPAPLTDGQRRLWFLHRLNPDRADYHLPLVHVLEGEPDLRRLHDVFAGLALRHDILRTRFVAEAGEPLQVADPADGSPLRVVDVRSAADPEEAARRVLAEAAAEPFDLAAGHPIRAVAVRVADADTRLATVLHHIAADARSLEVIVRDLSGDGEPPAPKARYADHAVRRRARDVDPADRAYWTERLRGLEPLTLPADRPRGPAGAGPSHGAEVRRPLPPHLAGALTDLARRLNTTPYTVLLAAFHVLLGRYCGTSDVATAAFLEERPHPDLEDVVGFFVETVVVRTGPAPGKAFARYAAEVHGHVADARTHAAMPFGRLVEELRPGRDRGGDPFARVSFALENAPAPAVIAGLRATPLPPPPLPVKYDLAATVMIGDTAAEGDAAAELVFAYRPDLFDPATVAAWADAYERLLTAVAADAERPLAELARASEDAPGTAEVAVPVPEDTADRLVAAWSLRTPQAVALTSGDRDITHGELGAAAARLARVLRRDHGVGPEIPVGVHLEAGPELVVCLLAVLGAGGVYVPLDPAHPRARQAAALAAVRPAVVLTDERLRERLPGTSTEVVVIDPFQPDPDPPAPDLP